MRITFVTIRPVLLLHIIFAFAVPVYAQTIPKSIDKPVKTKVIAPVRRESPAEVIKKNKILELSFFAKFRNGLVPVYQGENGQVVGGRELHKFLESKRQFTDWIKDRIEKYSHPVCGMGREF